MGGACKSNVVRSAENEGLRQKIEAVQLQIAAANAVNSQPVSVSAASAQELTETLARLAMQNQKLRLQKASNGTEPAGQSGQSRRIGNLRKRAATLKADNAALEQVMQEENGNTDTLPELQAELAELSQDGDQLERLVAETAGDGIRPEQLKELRSRVGKVRAMHDSSTHGSSL